MPDKKVDVKILRNYSPLDGLKPENLHALAKKTPLQEIAGGSFLFKQGDEQKHTIYLVSGIVDFIINDEVVRSIEGGDQASKNPLAPMLPRRCDARARNRIQYLDIDSDLLDVMLTWDQTGSYEVNDLRDGDNKDNDDWMTTLLQTKAFHRIPPANIQAIFMRMQQVNYKSGDVILKQGEEGDYFYVITNGKAQVTRETPLNKEGIKLAELDVGDTFGEEALISAAKRNATVTMLIDGSVMRLGKKDFQTLLNEPMLEWISPEAADEVITEGGQWLDVRLPSEFENFHQEGAINIPLYFLRLKLNTLDSSLKYVVCCDTGRRSSAAAFILSERGYQALVLKGGLTRAEVPGASPEADIAQAKG